MPEIGYGWTLNESSDGDFERHQLKWEQAKKLNLQSRLSSDRPRLNNSTESSTPCSNNSTAD